MHVHSLSLVCLHSCQQQLTLQLLCLYMESLLKITCCIKWYITYKTISPQTTFINGKSFKNYGVSNNILTSIMRSLYHCKNDWKIDYRLVCCSQTRFARNFIIKSPKYDISPTPLVCALFKILSLPNYSACTRGEFYTFKIISFKKIIKEQYKISILKSYS